MRFSKMFSTLKGMFCLAGVLAIVSSVAMAGGMDLAAAKKSGLVGEKQDGLVAATLPNPSGEIADLVIRTNQGRLQVYKDTAAKQGIPLSEVQKIAAQKIFGMAASGEFLMIDGQWKRK